MCYMRIRGPFSKVSALVYFLRKITVYSTFKKRSQELEKRTLARPRV